jgi:hypothetical protein
VTIRMSVPGKPIQHIDLGPALARVHRYDEMRKVLDVALGEPHRHRETPILRQP